ncbi:zinc finger, c4 type (two domains) domain-containing protein [Ditylenchus destructor]|uniref:Zinc finger, c4 type (Two domains) domain-containing protein n=1 Tax=Ditylenchus destructor TaxID=166010 RepID=A0AAD4QYR0_9BILA|nr:zinc finger, c4 type (two domains) domain-containing protein [Ditylenchus destructor]
MDGSTSTSSTQCSVCLSQHDGPHFGVLACQACSLFFRRTVFERKTYKCQKNNDCDILQGQMMCQYFQYGATSEKLRWVFYRPINKMMLFDYTATLN